MRGTDLAHRFRAFLRSEADPAGLALFRIGFGLVTAFSSLRFCWRGWVDELYMSPTFHFPYWGFAWVEPWPRPWMYAHMCALIGASLAIAVGYRTRLFALLFAFGFTYVELLDKTLYLNHYYLVSLLALLLTVVPGDSAASVESWLGRAKKATTGLDYCLFRGQVGLVYFFAGVAKLNADWIFRAEPVHGWLLGKQDLPLIGGLLGVPLVAYAMSAFGLAFDLGVPFFLSWRRTRAFAFALAAVFHLAIWLLFPVGVFSFVMLLSVTIFFEPDWPRRFRWFRRLPSLDAVRTKLPRSRFLPLFAPLHLLIQFLIPLRFALYPGPVNWTEEGFRFSWRVMLVEKQGHVEFRVRADGSPEERVFPRRMLTPLQFKMLATQADMMIDYAEHLRRLYERRGHRNVEVFADSFLSFNGRRSRRFIDPTVDLAHLEKGLAPLPIFLPMGPPPL